MMQTRRKFPLYLFRLYLVATVFFLLVNLLLTILDVQAKAHLTNEQKEAIIAKALETHEGREALARAMVEPLQGEE